MWAGHTVIMYTLLLPPLAFLLSALQVPVQQTSGGVVTTPTTPQWLRPSSLDLPVARPAWEAGLVKVCVAPVTRDSLQVFSPPESSAACERRLSLYVCQV